MHLADTEEQARRDVRFGLEDFGRYFRHILPVDPTGGADDFDGMLDFLTATGFAVVGTPDMAVAQLERLVKQSGGFGSFLVFAHDWADREATLRSYELFARSVMPHFQGSLVGPEASEAWVRGSGGRFVQAAANAIGQAMSDHEQQRAARHPALLRSRSAPGLRRPAAIAWSERERRLTARPGTAALAANVIRSCRGERTDVTRDGGLRGT